MHKYDETRGDHITDQVYAKGIWRGQLEDGTVMPIPEELIKEEFGSRFVKECKRLGHKKFVDIPVGSCRSSVMALLPELRSEKAPPVKFMQGKLTVAFSAHWHRHLFRPTFLI
jgi:hypothetical protein